MRTLGVVAVDEANIAISNETLLEFLRLAIARAAELGVNIATQDGLLYQFDAAGEFTFALSRNLSNSFQVQIRVQPYNGSTSVSAITQVATLVGGDRVTVGIGRAQPVWVDGVPTAVGPASPVVVSGGQIKALSANIFQISWNTGEVLKVTDYGSSLDLQVGVSSSDQSGSIIGLIGPNEGQENDFMLPDGTVLPQPLTTDELYRVFADAWRVPQQFSLLRLGDQSVHLDFH